jgi:hypothetical protein
VKSHRKKWVKAKAELRMYRFEVWMAWQLFFGLIRILFREILLLKAGFSPAARCTQAAQTASEYVW